MTEHRDRVLRIERTFDASLERVFAAWTSEEVLRRWLHGMPGWETPTAEVRRSSRGQNPHRHARPLGRHRGRRDR